MCGARRVKSACKKAVRRDDTFDSTCVHESHKLMRAADPGSIPIVFCSRCGGARAGRTGGLRESCLLTQDNERRKRLDRLSAGLHPYEKYKYFMKVVWPARSWEALEVPEGRHSCLDPGAGVGRGGGVAIAVLGQAACSETVSFLQAMSAEEHEDHVQALEAWAQEVGAESEDDLDPFG